MAADLLQLPFQVGDAAADLAAVDLQLRFTRPAHTDAAAGAAGASTGLPRQVGPGTRQARQPVFVLRQLHLHRALARLGVAGEDVKDQRGAIDHLDLLAQYALDLPLLARGKLLVEDHDIGAQLQHQRLQFAQLAGADEGGRVRMYQPLGQRALHGQACGLGQQRQLGERVLHRENPRLSRQADADQNRRLVRLVREDQALVIAHDRGRGAFHCAGEIIDGR